MYFNRFTKPLFSFQKGLKVAVHTLTEIRALLEKKIFCKKYFEHKFTYKVQHSSMKIVFIDFTLTINYQAL
jgi:hypothetical protein